ncbi:hypothetical protein AC579_6363 [Pseudocercospora musae]|uniref:Myb-like domain-containing protein n=1 Tax=Pseudocercospora musae TaxID=113226 RepID=A0A139HRW6_9PEZI|nr:hypothetical protein AC579_6363 [Pseudocercospora musae]
MPPPSIPGGWTDTDDKALLLGILKQVGAANIKWEPIASSLRGNVTASAAVQRYNKIKKDVSSASDSHSPAPKTPGKGKKTASTGKRKAAQEDEDADADADDVEEKTPTIKKAKKEVVKKESIEEDEDGDDDGRV